MNAPLLIRTDRGHFIQRVYDALRDDILAQRVRPGVKLIPEHIASALNVSRTPVRTALERLCQEGYVERIPARGYFVAEMDATEASDLYDVRHALEIRALENTIERGIPKDGVAQLSKLNAQYLELLDDEDLIGRSKADQEFHIALTALSGNALLLRMLRDIFDRLNFRRVNDGYWYWTDQGQRGRDASVEHTQIISALDCGDGQAALGALRGHLGNAHRNYRKFLATAERTRLSR